MAFEDFYTNPAQLQYTPLPGMNYMDFTGGARPIQSSWADAGAYMSPSTGRLTVPANIPPMGVLGGGFTGGMGMGGYGGGGSSGQLSPGAAAMATAERTQALKNLEGRAADYWNQPLAKAAQSNLLGIMGGEGPYSQDVQNRMFAQSADQIAGAQDAARQRAMQRAGASGLGFSGGIENRLANIEGQGALQRQGAMTGIQNQAALGNFAARQNAIGMANQALGTGYGVTNPLVQQAASARFNTEWGSGIGSDLTGGTAATARRRTSGANARPRITYGGGFTGGGFARGA
jgi:hypothetical protein